MKYLHMALELLRYSVATALLLVAAQFIATAGWICGEAAEAYIGGIAKGYKMLRPE